MNPTNESQSYQNNLILFIRFRMDLLKALPKRIHLDEYTQLLQPQRPFFADIWRLSMRFFFHHMYAQDISPLKKQTVNLPPIHTLVASYKQYPSPSPILTGAFIEISIQSILHRLSSPYDGKTLLEDSKSLLSLALLIEQTPYNQKIMLILTHVTLKLITTLPHKADILSQLTHFITQSNHSFIPLYHYLKHIHSAHPATLPTLLTHFSLPTKPLYQHNLLQLIQLLIASSIQTHQYTHTNVQQQMHSYYEVIMQERLSTFYTINMQQLCAQLYDVEKVIRQEKCVSVVVVICCRLNISSLGYLQQMHETVIFNSVHATKLCVGLFEAKEDGKLSMFLRLVQKRSECDVLKMIVQRNSVSEVTHYKALMKGVTQALLLRQESIMMYHGWRCYVESKDQAYISVKKSKVMEAMGYYEKSITINQENWVVCYNLVKIYMEVNQLQKCSELAMQCCRSSQGDHLPFTLLANLYAAEHRFNKASIIIDELIQKYNQPILYYYKAYLQTNKVLTEIEHNDDLQAAMALTPQLQSLIRQTLPLNISTVLESLQQYYYGSVNIPPSPYHPQYFLSTALLPSPCLLPICALLMELNQTALCTAIIKSITQPQHKSYYVPYIAMQSALLHIKNNQTQEAINALNEALVEKPTYGEAIIELAKLCPQKEYLSAAEKYTDSKELYFAKGVRHMSLGKKEEAYQMFIMASQREQGWIDMQPDAMY